MSNSRLASVFVAVFGFSVLSFGQATATLIDFDTAPTGGLNPLDILSDQYSSFGVTFAGYENGTQRNVYVDNNWGRSSDGLYLTNYGPSSRKCCSTDRLDIVSVLFSSSVTDVVFNTFSGWGVDVTFQAYDATGAFLGSTIGSGQVGWSSVDLSVFGSLARVDVLQGGDGYTYALDNLSFTPSDVSEPSALLLFGLGVIGVGVIGRRRLSW